MTKKDFELIARVFAQSQRDFGDDPEVTAGYVAYADDMADALASTNPRFDRERFLAACEGRTRKVRGEYVAPEQRNDGTHSHSAACSSRHGAGECDCGVAELPEAR